jgi:predicted RNA methylase
VATDRGKLTLDLGRFYDFQDKVVVHVGAGGGQLLSPSIRTRKRIAIDQDADALMKMKESTEATAVQDSVEIICGRFEDFALAGDVVCFEFCLHEMVEPLKALTHARTLARDIVVFDHSPGSDWIFYGAEEDKVRRSADAMESFGIRRRETFLIEQHFRDHAELLAKVAVQGDLAIQRAQRFAGVTDIVIPMRYELALL